MSVTRTVARNTGLQAVGRLLYLIISILMIKLLTQMLGVAGYGQYGFLVDYLGFFGILVDLGLYLIAVQRITQIDDAAARTRAIGELAGLRLVSALLIYVFAGVLIFLLPYDPGLKWAVAIATLSFFSFSLAQLFSGVFQGFLRAEFAATAEVLGRAVTFLCLGAVYLLDGGLWAVSIALIVGNGVNVLFSLAMARRLIAFRFIIDWTAFRRILREAVPIGAILTISYLYIRQDTFILSLHPNLPDGLTNSEAIGYYKAPFKLLETIQGFPGLFMTALFPFLNKYIADGDGRLPLMCQKAFDFLTALAVPLIVGTVLLAQDIMLFISSPAFLASALTLQILIFAVSFSFLNNFFGHLVVAQKKQTKLILPNIFFLIINLGLNFLLIPRFAYNGSAVATVITETVVIAINLYVVRRIMGWTPHLRVVGKILIAALPMAVVIWTLARIGVYFLLAGAAGTAVYLWLLSALGGLPDGMSLGELIRKTLRRPPPSGSTSQ
jgi:O-antigen/teichoic acid export membrane protein